MQKIIQTFRHSYRQAFKKQLPLPYVLQLGIFILILYLFALSFLMRSSIPLVSVLFIWIGAVFIKKIIPSNIGIFVVESFGFFLGIIRLLFLQIVSFFKKYPSLIVLFLGYIVLMVSVIDWGLPTPAHPFVYHMDEWHQLQSIQGVFTHGTPNIPGAAHGPQLQWFLSGLYLVPFVLLGIVNPFVLSSPLEDIAMQKQLFEVLRFNSLLFGIFAAYIVGKIASDFFKVHPFFSVFFFLFTPSFLAFSNYYKYDIALLFWIVLASYFFLQSIQTASKNVLYISFFVAALATATKITALPLVGIFSLFYFFTAKTKKDTVKILLYCGGIFILSFLLFGIPDVLFGKGDYYEFFFSNLVSTPSETFNYFLGMPYILYLLLYQFPANFGHPLSVLFLFSLGYFLIKREKNMGFFVLSFFVFFLSLAPMKLFATGNRAMVILPFLALITGITMAKLLFTKNVHKATFILIGIVVVLQVAISLSWMVIKWSPDPRATASFWIEREISQNESIGIENIPIYQMIPDILLKNFYEKQYGEEKPQYDVVIIDPTVPRLPDTIVVTNTKVTEFQKKSVKKDLLVRMQKEKYKKVAQFVPDLSYYQFFGSILDFYIPIIIPTPTDISIYRKEEI